VIAGVADTHTALWYLSKHPRLSLTARNFIASAAEAGNEVVISPISLAEILYLIEKNRMPLSAYEDVKAALADPASVLQEAPSTSTWWTRCGRCPVTISQTCLTESWRRQLSFWACLSSAGMARIRASAIRTIW
jgi:predicted nucleic acid-binding protein